MIPQQKRTSVGENVKNRSPCAPRSWWECEMVHLLLKTVRWFLKMLNTELPCEPAILLLGRYPREMKMGTQTNIVSPHYWQTLFSVNSPTH